MDWDDLGPNQKRYRVNLEQEGKCNTCSISEWLNKPVSLELDHIDGDRDNNSRENLRLLCPNCHSQTPTWKGKHKDKMRKLSDEDLIRIMKSSDNIRQTLLKAGMDPKSANYNKIKDILWSLIDKQDQ